jgi:type I restriction enzyme S subunit
MDMRLRLYFDQFGQIPVPVPPVDEQQAIINFYSDATADTDRIINQTHREISLLREYRTRLIADVVTGKLDVREAAAQLPDEIEESEPLDETEPLSDADEDAADDLVAASEEDEP